MNLLRNATLVAIPLAVAAVVGIGTYMLVSDSEDVPDLSKIQVESGRVSCEMFQVARGYSYATVVVLDLKDRPPEMEPTDGYRAEGFKFTTEVVGEVDKGEDQRATIFLKEQDQLQQFIVADDIIYGAIAEGGWKEYSEQTYRPQYSPREMCNAIAPDIQLAGLDGTLELVGDIRAIKYHFDDLETDFPDRHASFGPQSDAAVYVNNYVGDIWVAEEGGYIVKLDLIGLGAYDNGRGLEIDYAYQLSDVNAKIKVEAPDVLVEG